MSGYTTLIGLPSFYGKGLAFPMRLDDTNARPLIEQDEALIQSSIAIILNTDTSERPFLRKNGVPFGTRISRILFDSALVAIDIIRFEAKRALDVWEPRIITDFVTANEQIMPDGGSAILADIRYRYRSTNRPDNLVVPFQFRRNQ